MDNLGEANILRLPTTFPGVSVVSFGTIRLLCLEGKGTTYTLHTHVTKEIGQTVKVKLLVVDRRL